MTKYMDDYGRIVMYCNSCGDETIEPECCDDGEVIHYGDCTCEDCA